MEHKILLQFLGSKFLNFITLFKPVLVVFALLNNKDSTIKYTSTWKIVYDPEDNTNNRDFLFVGIHIYPRAGPIFHASIIFPLCINIDLMNPSKKYSKLFCPLFVSKTYKSDQRYWNPSNRFNFKLQTM